jgi:hypothetical protein
VEEESSEGAPVTPPKRVRLGLYAAVAVFAVGLLVGVAWAWMLTPRPPAPQPLLVARDDVGEWLKVYPAGKGEIVGWAEGTTASSSEGNGAAVPSYQFTIVNLGMAGGRKVALSVMLAVDDKTTFALGAAPIKPDAHHRTAADVVFDTTGDKESPILDGGKKLTVRFHRSGDWFVADSVVASTEESDSGPPFFF